MQLYFLIVCHKITPSLRYNLKKFSKFKYSKVLVHIDQKSDFTENDLVASDNITYLKDSVNVQWGSISQVLATYKMFEQIKGEQFDYVSLLSGEDLFIRSEDEFIDFLKRHKGKEFIGVQQKNGQFVDIKKRYMYRYSSRFFGQPSSFLDRLLLKITSFLFQMGFSKNTQRQPYSRFYKGSNWFTVSKTTMNLLMDEIKAKHLFEYFKDSFCIDEVIFQTILMNNNFKDSIYLINGHVSDNKMSLRYVNWEDGPDYPKLLNKEDLLQTFDNDIFFVRKISSALNEQDLELIFDRSSK